MKEPLTDELLQELLDAPSVESYTDAHKLTKRTLSQYLQQLLDARGFERASVVHAANINETFGYQIFTGARGASRDKLLALAFALECSLTETNRLLQAGGSNGLYCKNRRDAIIIFCITHSYSLQKTNEELHRFKEDILD